jgi:hypothetical protein
VAGPTLDEVQTKLDPEELASARQATAGPKLDKLVSKMLARGSCLRSLVSDTRPPLLYARSAVV